MRPLPTLMFLALATALVAILALRSEPSAPPVVIPPLSASPQRNVTPALPGPAPQLEAFSQHVDGPLSVTEGFTWYRPSRPLPSPDDDMYLYFGFEEAGLTEPMLLIQRRKKEDGYQPWIVVADVDGRLTTLYVSDCQGTSFFGVERFDHTPAGAPRETLTFGVLSREVVATIRAMTVAKRVVLRYSTKTLHDEQVIPPEKLASMKTVIDAYELLTGKPWVGEDLPAPECA